MNPELKTLHSPDLEIGVAPLDPSHATVLVQALIGPQGEIGEESFSLTVVTRLAAAELPTPRWGRGLLLVDTFSWPEVRVAIEKILRHCEAETWRDVATKINRYMPWEFEDDESEG